MLRRDLQLAGDVVAHELLEKRVGRVGQQVVKADAAADKDLLDAGELAQLGDEKTAAEYRQLWDIVVSALEQCAAVLGDTAMDSGEFSRLFTLMLSKYDIGTIPVSLDRVSAGDFDRNRRRSIKHLIVLGASDQRLPRTDDEAGVFSPEERERLLEMQLELGAGGESELWREFSLIYTCLTMPSESLTMLCPVADTQGAELRPAFVFNRAKALFGLSVMNASLSDARMSAPAPALGLAAQSMHGGDGRARAAAEYFAESDPARFASLEAAANMSRGRLSSAAVEKLYGQRLRLSASRIDKFASCRFAYFCQYGLRAKPYEPAAFRPPEIGTFMHYVLEKTAREVKRRGGFAAVDDKTLRELCEDIGVDAARWFFVSKDVATHMDLDLKLARSKDNNNPVYYAQYAYSRMCSILRNPQIPEFKSVDVYERLTDEKEMQMLKLISEFPKEVAADALNRKPNKMTEYIISLVKVFHSYYNSTKVNNPDDPELTNERIGLIKAAMITLKNALNLVGVSRAHARPHRYSERPVHRRFRSRP